MGELRWIQVWARHDAVAWPSPLQPCPDRPHAAQRADQLGGAGDAPVQLVGQPEELLPERSVVGRVVAWVNKVAFGSCKAVAVLYSA